MRTIGKAFLYAVLFAVIGMVIFALLAPLLFPDANPRRLGQLSGAVILLVAGGIGFVVRWFRAKKSEQS
jgi:hypothetical protein